VEKDLKVLKQKMLASIDFETGASSMNHYGKI